jgi:hypothetical protein
VCGSLVGEASKGETIKRIMIIARIRRTFTGYEKNAKRQG